MTLKSKHLYHRAADTEIPGRMRLRKRMYFFLKGKTLWPAFVCAADPCTAWGVENLG